MKRGLALSAGAFVAAIMFSSCSSVDHADVAASVNGHDLTRDQLATLAGNTDEGPAVRDTITTWIETVAVSGSADGITSPAELATRKQAALTTLLDQLTDGARTNYELGVDSSPFLCLAAIPLDGTVAGADVLAELEAGATFADTATKYSADETLASAGGIVSDQGGAECIATDSFSPELIAALSDAQPAAGVPTLTELAGNELVIMLRPYDELTLTDSERLQLVATEFSGALRDTYKNADIDVDARFGTWDAGQGMVVALGEG